MNINVKGLPLSLDQASVEEQLMLLGYAKTEEEAALIAYGGKKKMRDKNKVPQLYTALDPEEDERAMKAVEEMSDAMMQLQEAVAAAHTDPSILKVINQTKDFFLYGIQPTRGLDDVDKLMTRKRTLVEQCGNMTDHYIYYNGVSKHLLCATRIHVMNETDVTTLCPMQGGAFWAEEKKCEGGGFNWTLPISEWNENITIQTIRDTVTVLQKEYKTTIEEDDNLLQLSTLPKITRAAIVVRKREKELLESVINFLDNRRANLSNLTHQIEGVRKLEKERKARLKEIAEFKERTRAQFSIPKKTVSFPIKLGKGNSPNFTVYEGQDLELMAAQFVQTHGLKEGLIKTIIKNARKRVRKGGELEFHTPIILDNGTRVCLRLYKGGNITTEIRKIGAIYNITEAQLEIVIRLVKEKYEQRMAKKVLVEFPVTVPDGRNIVVKVREGEEHDLITHFRDLMMAMNMDIDYIQLANIAFQRLPPIALKIPVEMPGKMTETFHYRQGQNPTDTVVAFCHYYGYTRETYTQIMNAVQQRLRL
jgi:hypothetical protein